MKVEFPYIDDSLNVFEERFFDKDVTMFCAFLNDEFVGFIDIQITNDDAIIAGIAVKPEFRNQSIGTQLTEKALEYFKKNGCKKIILEVSNNNINAVKLYEKFGFNFLRKASDKTHPASFLFKQI